MRHRHVWARLSCGDVMRCRTVLDMPKMTIPHEKGNDLYRATWAGHFHERSPSWPKDGQGTGYVEF